MAEKDAQGNTVYDIEVGADWKHPTDDRPVFGTRRLVKLIPTPVGAFPCLWMSNKPHRGPDGGLYRNAIVIIQKDPKPQTMALEINVEGVEKLPLVPLEW